MSTQTQVQAHHDAAILQNLRYNFIYNIFDSAFFGSAIGFASFITIIPLFVSTLTDSAILIGLIPAIHNMGWQLPQLLIANRVSRQLRYKPMVLVITIHERLPFLGLALLVWLAPHISTSTALFLAFALLVWQGLGAGFTATPWQSMIAKIFPPDRRATVYGSQSAAFNVLSSISAVLAGYLLRDLESPLDFTLCFLLATVFLVLSWVALYMVREPANPEQMPYVDNATFWRNVAAIFKRDINFRWFIIARMLSQVAVMGFSFYTVYVVNVMGLDEMVVGIMTGILMATSIIANPLMGWIADRWSYRWIMAIGMLSAITSGVLANLAPDPRWFYLVFVMAGIANVAVWTIPIAMTPEFGTLADRPAYIGMANTFSAPITVLAPLFGGWLAESSGYQLTFMASAFGGLATVLVLLIFLRNPKKNRPAVSISPEGH